MAQDHDGNTLNVGDKCWIPVTITSIGSNGLTVQTSYSGATLAGPVNPTDGHKSGNFPDRP